jgi:NAD(P)H-flavin reductase
MILQESPPLPAVAHPMRPVAARVRRNHRETRDTFSIELDLLNGERPAFLPGQFNMLYLFGIGEVPISISGDPTAPGRIVHTTREVGAVTRAIRNLKQDDHIGVRGPFGNSWPVEAAEGRELVIVAGGIGLAPLRPVIYHAMAHRDRYARLVILYGTRTPEEILFKTDIRRWRSLLDVDIQVTVDRATSGWRGNVGVITQLIPRAGFSPRNVLAMVCGPEIMMRYAAQALERRGVAQDQIYLSMERNMKCAVGLCGHCQLGPTLICRDGPIYRYDEIAPVFGIGEL